MSLIKQNLEDYLALEGAVRDRMGVLFSDSCGMCTACCCRVDICEESLHSAFLARLLKRQHLAEPDLNDRFGWLDLHGCTLAYGRPPVCYRFFCSELLAGLPDDESRFVVQILGRLIEFVGENALGTCHLVEIEDPDDLDRIDHNAFQARLVQARTALGLFDQYMESGRLSSADRAALEAIGLPED